MYILGSSGVYYVQGETVLGVLISVGAVFQVGPRLGLYTEIDNEDSLIFGIALVL